MVATSPFTSNNFYTYDRDNEHIDLYLHGDYDDDDMVMMMMMTI